MYIIAETKTDQNLEDLIDQYDFAKSDEQREQFAAEVYRLVGAKIRSMIQYAAKGHRLSQDQLDALAWQALFKGINETGIQHFKKSSAPHGDWTPQIEKMIAAARINEPSPSGRIWSMLSEATRAAILQNPTYIKTSVQHALIADLNAMLRRPDLYSSRLWHRDSVSFEARDLLSRGIEKLSASQLARLNVQIIASAFPGISIPPVPQRNLLGYISRSVIPTMKPAIFETATGRTTDRTLTEAWNALKADIAAVQQMESTGALPDEWNSLSEAGRIYEHQKRRLNERYGPALSWLNDQVKRIQPQNPFIVNSASSLKYARELLEQDGVPPELYQKGGQYYLPADAVRPYGTQTIERLLSTEGFARPSKPQAAPVVPLYAQQPESEDAMRLLQGGHESRAFKYLVDKLFSRPGYELEHSVGVFLATTPRPTNVQIDVFLEQLPESDAEAIQNSGGFRQIVQQIDSEIVNVIQHQPEIQRELMQMFGSPRPVASAINAIRRTAFLRTNELYFSKAG